MIITSSNAVVLIVLVLLVQRAQLIDPLKRFCRRFGHSTALIDQRLYIDGGLVNWSPISPNSLNHTSETNQRDLVAKLPNLLTRS
jgi:phage tail protein X